MEKVSLVLISNWQIIQTFGLSLFAFLISYQPLYHTSARLPLCGGTSYVGFVCKRSSMAQVWGLIHVAHPCRLRSAFVSTLVEYHHTLTIVAITSNRSGNNNVNLTWFKHLCSCAWLTLGRRRISTPSIPILALHYLHVRSDSKSVPPHCPCGSLQE